MPPPSTSPFFSTLYFAYGSNLSLTQMSSRCPSSLYHSLGVLKGYKWVIGPRGYANVVKRQKQGDEKSGQEEEVVYGMLYRITMEDEQQLDIAESVPDCYEKWYLEIEILTIDNDHGTPVKFDEEEQGEGKFVKALVYVDVARPGEGVCKEEYVGRMNRGIRDAVAKGMPESYVRGVLRRWVREEEVKGDGEVEDPFHPDKM